MLRKVLGNSAKCVVQSVILVINGCCSKCNFAYMKTKIILAALMVVGVLSGKTEKKMNETLNQKQQALVAVAALASGRCGKYPCRGEALARCCSRLVVSAYCNRCPG